MTATVATIQSALKTYYPQSKIEETLLKKNPLYALLDKNTEWVGNPMHIALTIAPTAGGSFTFATAQSNKTGATHVHWEVTWVRDYSLFGLTTEAVRASRNDKGALMRAIKAEGDGAMNTLQRSMAIMQYGNGGGARGRIASGADSTTLVLTDRRDIVKFEIGMQIVSSADDGTTGAASANAGTISAINYDTGGLTVAGGGNWHADFDTNDYLFREGDFGAAMSGLPAWIPPSAPTATTFFGLDRSQETRKLGGVRLDYSVADHGSMQRYLVALASEICLTGGEPSTSSPRRSCTTSSRRARPTATRPSSASRPSRSWARTVRSRSWRT
jgi:hypothetical protein